MANLITVLNRIIQKQNFSFSKKYFTSIEEHRAQTISHIGKILWFVLLYFFFFCLLARGWIGAMLPAYATATATPDSRHVWDPLQHSPQQQQIPNPLSKARDWTGVLMDVYCILRVLVNRTNPCMPPVAIKTKTKTTNYPQRH